MLLFNITNSAIKMHVEEAIQDYAEQPITRQMMLGLLKNYKRPYDKISELVKHGTLTPLKSGLYLPGPQLRINKPEPFLLANHLLGPSYVSMEAALSYWSFIPERVYEVSSATTQNSKLFKTAMGRFSYTHIPLPYYSFGIKQVALTSKQAVMVASPEKALCDKIITTSGILLRSVTQVTALLTEDFRIEREKLLELNTIEIAKWISDAPKKNSLAMLVKTLQSI